MALPLSLLSLGKGKASQMQSATFGSSLPAPGSQLIPKALLGSEEFRGFCKPLSEGNRAGRLHVPSAACPCRVLQPAARKAGRWILSNSSPFLMESLVILVTEQRSECLNKAWLCPGPDATRSAGTLCVMGNLIPAQHQALVASPAEPPSAGLGPSPQLPANLQGLQEQQGRGAASQSPPLLVLIRV